MTMERRERNMFEAQGVTNVGEVVMANSAVLRNMIVFLLATKAISPPMIDHIFEQAKGILREEDIEGLEEAIAFLDHQRASIDLTELPAAFRPH